MSFREIEKIVTKDGWVLKAIAGSHYQYVHNEKHSKVTIPKHKGDISVGVIKSILKSAEIFL